MIYFRRNNGELGSVTYGSLEDDIEMLGSRVELRTDIVNSISRYQNKEEFNGQKPVPKSAFLVLVK